MSAKVLNPKSENKNGLSVLPVVATSEKYTAFKYEAGASHNGYDLNCPDCTQHLGVVEHGQIAVCSCGATWVLYGAGLNRVSGMEYKKYYR